MSCEMDHDRSPCRRRSIHLGATVSLFILFILFLVSLCTYAVPATDALLDAKEFMNYSAVFSMLFLPHCGQVAVLAQCYPEVIVVASDGASGNYFGSSVAIDGNNALVGAVYDDDLGDRSGSAYIFSEVSPGTWVQVAKLVASDGAGWDEFGNTVAISGNNALVGAYADDDLGDASGSAYIFSEVSPGIWVQVAKFVASDGAYNDHFGQSVAIDGNNALCGAWLDNDLGSASGSAYIFSEVSPGTWVQLAKLLASDGAADHWFGSGVAIEGNNALCGAGGDDDLGYRSGSAYIFSEVSPGTWVEVAKLVPSDGAVNDVFGITVAISGNNALCGASLDDDLGGESGSAYIFSEVSPGTWTQVAKLVASDGAQGDYFGSSVAIDGNNALIGAHKDDDLGTHSGSAYVFSEVSPGTWTQVDKITASDGTTSDKFGQSVSISGVNVLVGSEAGEAAYLYFLDDVDDCPGNACEHGATCIDALYGDYCCVCPPAYGGEFCTDCLCENAGVCQDDALGIGYCDCSDVNWYGDTCSNKFCNNGVGETYPALACNCTLSGATGKFCTQDVDDCLSSPCANGGTCSDYGADLFPNHAHEFNCSCPADYYGLTCSDTLCYSSPCLNNGTCSNGRDLACNCTDTGYEGEFCQSEIDECASSPCLNDGVCTDLLRGFSCDCTGTGYEGLTCFNDIDDCASSPCVNDGRCQDKGANQFKCNCNEYWEGNTCEINIDDCVTNACQTEAICVDGLGNYTCICTMAGYEGEFCDIDIDECVSSPCEHDGVCIDLWLDFSCDCTDLAYEGELCEIYIPCLSLECQNGGTCDNDVCLCPNGYTGEFCEETLGVVVDAEPIVFVISFASFARDSDNTENFASELPVLLAEATPGTVASDFDVRVLDNDEQISYEVTFQNYQELELAEVQDAVEDAPFIEERINGDVVVTSQIEEEEEDEKKEEEDMTWLIIVLVLVGIVLVAGGGYAAKQYHDKQQASSKRGTFKADKMNMPV